jgi:pimeloyl-ACP methyl ester carboxylesterase
MKDAMKRGLLVLLATFAAQVTDGSDFPNKDDKQPHQPTLYIAVGEPNGVMTRAEDANLPSRRAADEWKIVIATHGWFEREPWPRDLSLAIKDKVDANEWLCGWLDWRKEAKFINPRDAAEYARDTAGLILAEQLLKLSKNPEHIHLIGHSAGCWAISEAAKILAKQTKANIHLTFLDAYVPLGWDANELGNIAAKPGIYWADHYSTRDITLKVTEPLLIHAHNVDIGNVTPGLKDHEFPRYWYPATVLGKYVPDDRYDGKKLYTRINRTEYGFARSLEAGKQNWEESLKLPMGNEAVKLLKPKKPFSPFGWLFKAKQKPQ